MNARTVAAACLALLCLAAGAVAFQRQFREFGGERPLPLPPDANVPAEFVFAHLMYPSYGNPNWRRGGSSQGWANDYPAADRHLMVALRRLTALNVRSVEQPVNLEDGDDVFDWPFLYAVRTNRIALTEEMTTKLREYLDRGGFLVADDMWGSNEHEAIMELMSELYPERELEELGDDAAVMHTLFDLENRYQIIGQWGRFSGFQPLNGASDPHWKGMFDEKRHMTIAVWLNNDTGDSWEWADDPSYPEHYSALGFRIMINHIAYAMTH